MRSGYLMTARHSCGEVFETYAEAVSPSLGAQRCLEEFPPEKDYTDHRIKDFETNAEYLCKRKEPEPNAD